MKVKFLKNNKGKAEHKGTGDMVTFKVTTGFLGDLEFKIRFDNGETTILSKSRFNELFVVK